MTVNEERVETEEDREEKDKGGSEDGKEDMVTVLGQLLEIASKPEKNDQGLSARAILDLQVSWLRNLQPFNPDREDLAAWCSMVEELLPLDTVPKDAVRLLGTRLPRHLGEILRNCIAEIKTGGELSWVHCINLFTSRVKGSDSRIAMSKKAQRIRQREGEGIRSFAIRASTELHKIWGRPPSSEEWKQAVMMGAHEATVLEMDRVESSNGGGDLWKTITAAEYWERQNKALLSLPDSDEPRGSLGPPTDPNRMQLTRRRVSRRRGMWMALKSRTPREQLPEAESSLWGVWR